MVWPWTITQTCKTCGKTFEAEVSQVEQGKGLYCSRSCSAKARSKPPQLITKHCEWCHQPFQVGGKRNKKVRCCSRSCAAYHHAATHPRKCTDPITRFWSHVNKLPGDNACWLWTGKRSSTGYGSITLPGKKTVSAHRFAYETLVGPIPPGQLVRHSCDTPLCVRPDHLIPGTQKQNMQDAIDRKRTATGEHVNNAKLTVAQVRQIRSAHANGTPQKTLARQYHVYKGTISEIVHRRTWKLY